MRLSNRLSNEFTQAKLSYSRSYSSSTLTVNKGLLAQRHTHAHPPSRPALRASLAPLPARHPRQSARPRRVSHPVILSSSIPARIPRSLTSPDCSRCRLALVHLSAGRTTNLMALEHRLYVRKLVLWCVPTHHPTCHASMPPATHTARSPAHPLVPYPSLH